MTLGALEGALRARSALPPGFRETGRSSWHVALPGEFPEYRNRPVGGPDPICPHGFRGACVPVGRIPGVPRIAALGDSVTFGQGVRGDEAWPAMLGGLLAEDLGRPVEVLNAAVPAYDLARAAASYTRAVRPLRPDLVVLGLFSNDLEEQQVVLTSADPPAVTMVVPERAVLPGERILPLSIHGALLRHSFLYAWANARTAAPGPAEVASEGNTRRARARHHLSRLERDTREDGADLVVALIPPVVLRDPDPARCGDPGVDPGTSPRGLCAEAAAALDDAEAAAASLGLTTVDLRPVFRAAGAVSLAVAADDPGHPGPEGHRVIAEGLREASAGRLAGR